jgi:hypothetical protein
MRKFLVLLSLVTLLTACKKQENANTDTAVTDTGVTSSTTGTTGTSSTDTTGTGMTATGTAPMPSGMSATMGTTGTETTGSMPPSGKTSGEKKTSEPTKKKTKKH